MTRFEKFAEKLENKLEGFKVKFKDESIFMKILGKLMFFNRNFMNSYITTIWKTVYFPTKSSLNGDQNNKIVTLAHEFVHARDAESFFKFLYFSFLYMFPQALAFCALIIIPFNWILGLILFVILLTPIPAPGRTYYETRGYTMSLYVHNELLKKSGLRVEDRRKFLEEAAKAYNNQFTSSSYYFMWPFGVEKKLNENINLILSEKIITTDKTFSDVKLALQEAEIV